MSNNTNLAINLPISTSLKDKIVEIKDLTSPGVSELHVHATHRARVVFTNGYALSIIRGEYTHGGDEGLYEIAPMGLNGHLDGNLLDEEDQGDDVLGWCDEAKVNYYITKLANLPKQETSNNG